MRVEDPTQSRQGLKIKGIEFIHPGVARLRFGADGFTVEDRDPL